MALSVGRHTRVPRTYRGRDIMWWLDAVGALHRPVDPDPVRRVPSLQLVGRTDRAVDLPALVGRGVRLAGRMTAARGRTLHFSDNLAVTVDDSDRRLTRLLHRLDIFAGVRRLDLDLDPPDPPRQAATAVGNALHRMDVDDVGSILWATGFRRGYPWLQLAVLDAAGEIRQRRGRTPAPGLFVIGLPRQTRRHSTFLDGVRFEGGATASFEASRFALGRKNAMRFEINGSAGSLAFDFEDMNVLHYFDGSRPSTSAGFTRILATEPDHPYLSSWWPPGHGLGYEHGFTHQVIDLVRAIDSGSPARPTFSDGLHVQRVLAAVQDSSAHDSRWQSIPTDN